MSSVNDGGGRAFPIPGDAGVHAPEFGMSLWEYFAAHAPDSLTGADPALSDICALLGVSEKDYDWTVHWPQAVAILRTRYADAMLARRGVEDPRIEAAIEMLRALKSLASTVLGLNDDDEETRRDIPELRQAEAAIEKAKAAGLKV